MDSVKKFFINLALSYVGALVQSLGIPNCTQLAVALGKAFGPTGCRHWAELASIEQTLLLNRAPILATLHTDWPKGFQWVPRSLTCYVMPNDQAPPIIYGTGTIEDIPEPGTFVVTEGYLAATSTSKIHTRFGFRWDRNDKYLEFPAFTVKQLK